MPVATPFNTMLLHPYANQPCPYAASVANGFPIHGTFAEVMAVLWNCYEYTLDVQFDIEENTRQWIVNSQSSRLCFDGDEPANRVCNSSISHIDANVNLTSAEGTDFEYLQNSVHSTGGSFSCSATHLNRMITGEPTADAQIDYQITLNLSGSTLSLKLTKAGAASPFQHAYLQSVTITLDGVNFTADLHVKNGSSWVVNSWSFVLSLQKWTYPV